MSEHVDVLSPLDLMRFVSTVRQGVVYFSVAAQCEADTYTFI